jgi:protein-tyrosine phosphatase
VPIIAHLERYKKLVGDIKSVDELISKGAYIQINSEALTDGFKVRSFAKKLLKERMVQFLATDAHDTKRRAPKLSKAVSYIEKHYGGSYCRELVIDNPERVINNEYISG